MYSLNIENVQTKHREYLRDGIWDISPLFKVNCKKDNALVVFNEPYNMDEKDLSYKSECLGKLRAFITQFRIWQFEAVTI